MRILFINSSRFKSTRTDSRTSGESLLSSLSTTDSSITRQIATYLSTTNSSHGGGHVFVYTPSGDTKYSAVTSGAWVLGWQGGNNSQSVQRLANITVPANSTVLVFVGSSHHYVTSYRFKDLSLIHI